jgi:hypothetical protein
MEQIGRSIGGRVEFFPRPVFFPTIQAKTGLNGFPNRSDRFRPVGSREGFLSKEVPIALWLLLFRCGKALEVFWVFGEFLDKVGLTGFQTDLTDFPCLREAKSNRSGLTGFRTNLTGLDCQQPCRVCFRCVCVVAVGWVLLLGLVALQWLHELGKRSLQRCTREIGFIG